MVYAPHGIYGLGATVSLQTPYCGFKESFPGINIRTGTLDTNFYIPFWREWQFAFKYVMLLFGMCVAYDANVHITHQARISVSKVRFCDVKDVIPLLRTQE